MHSIIQKFNSKIHSIMRKIIYTIILAIGMSAFANAQSQRLVLLEHFTQASCGPCATYNPSIHTLLTANPDMITSIMYHTSWPGYDPMYNHNTVENGARTGYYGVNSVPNSVLDGNVYNGHPNGWNIGTVNARYAVTSPVELSMYHELSADQSTLTVTMMIYATEDIAPGMKAHMAVIEKHIHFNSPPGSNGEIDFYNVMKKMLPNQSGTILPAMQAGEYMILQYSWEHQNVYNVDELAAVGFIQNNDTKEVYQAANSSDVLFDPLFSTDADVTRVDNVAQSYCNGMVQPIITIRNNGSDQLTSLDVSYSINGGTSNTMSWTGSLGFLETDVVTLDEASFSVEEMNEIEVVLSNPNGTDDDYAANNIKLLEVPKAFEATSPITLILKLDSHPEETTWEFTNNNGDVLYEGGPYSTPNQNIVQQFQFDATDCYTFTMYDAGGDGLTGGGSFAVGFGTSIIAQGNTFGEKAFGQFNIMYTGITPNTLANDYSIFPNPASDNLNIKFNLVQQETVSYKLTDPSGRIVKENSLGVLSAGERNESLDVTDLSSGVYYVVVTIGSNQSTEKIVITK